MLSRNQYSGRLPYDVYVERYKKHSAALPKAPTVVPDRQSPDKVVPDSQSSTQKEIKDYLDKNKKDLDEKTRKLIEEQIQKKTGAKIGELDDVINKFKDKISGDNEDAKQKREHIFRGLQLAKASNPNTKNISRLDAQRAKLVKAARLGYMNDDNFESAQSYIDNEIGPGFTIDKDLSKLTDTSIVVKTPEGNTEIAIRGSQIFDKFNIDDMKANARMLVGAEGNDPQFNSLASQYEQTLEKYGNVDMVSGHSKGAGQAMLLGDRYDVATTSFNPLVPQKVMSGNVNPTKPQKILRTTKDTPSLGLGLSKNINANYEIQAVRPLKRTGNTSYNPIKIIGRDEYHSHKLDNFTSPRDESMIDMTPSDLEILARKQIGNGRKMNEYKLAEDFLKDIRSGKTYSEAYFELQRTNNPNFIGDGDVQLRNGKPIIRHQSETQTRHIEDSGAAKFWKALGGKFTDEEQSILSERSGTKSTDLIVENPGEVATSKAVAIEKPVGSKDKLDKMIDDTSEYDDFLKQIQKELDEMREGTGITDEELTRDAPSDKEFEENIKKLGLDEGDYEPSEQSKLTREDRIEAKKRAKIQQDSQMETRGEDFNPFSTDEVSDTQSTVRQSTDNDDFISLDEPTSEPTSVEEISSTELKNYSSMNETERANVRANSRLEFAEGAMDLGHTIQPVEPKNFTESFGDSVSAGNFIIGAGVGYGVDKLLDYVDSPENEDGTARKQKISGVGREALSGGLTGGIMSSVVSPALGLETAGLLPEVIAGSAAYVVGSETGKLAGNLTKKLGGNEDAQLASSDLFGGASGGLAAAGSLAAYGALSGAEAGTALGPVGILVGGGIGLAGGLLAFGGQEIYKHREDIKEGFEDVGKGIASAAKSVGSFFKSIF